MKCMNDVFIASRFLYEIHCLHINHFDLLSDLNRTYENSNTINKSVMVRL